MDNLKPSPYLKGTREKSITHMKNLTLTAVFPLLLTRPISTAYHYYPPPPRGSWWWVPLASKFHTAHNKGLKHYQRVEHRGARVYNHLPWSLLGIKWQQTVTICQRVYHGVIPPTRGKLKKWAMLLGSEKKVRKEPIYTSQQGHADIYHVVSGIYVTMETC